ncbi:hypothetical protein EJ04DRAFT_70778 [Polyplosphaeria fusca]|uniref:Uncharacterized protein n=1 Tax=Polyplosphaeria fusca TaxID=682080 RepID=A0A9P4R786_9PLEO|nr:hypothetical protein EJ04DRAFT_70778 [Polyplosphaeria fusca]
MEGVPSPLRIGSPATTRKPSGDSVPAALRAGSPVVGRGTPPQTSRPPLTRKNTSGGSDRLSQLFPSRPPSVVSPASDPPASRRTSYPSPLTPAAGEPAYRIPRAPAPPTFSEDTSYNASPDAFGNQPVSPPALSQGGTKALLNRLTSLRSARAKGGAYNKLEDEESGRKELRDVDEVDEPVGYDLSGFDGHPMRSFEPKKMSAADAREQERTMDEAGYAAEYERLEAQLGAGMSAIHEVPFTHDPKPEQKSIHGLGHKRGLSGVEMADAAARNTGQKEAEKTGGIVAVADIPIDISESYGGADFDSRSILTTSQVDDGSKTSYFFPQDPDMPSWRPFSMGWPWLAMLVFIALALAGLQEFLCQLSMKRAKSNQPNDGLIRFKKPGDLSVTEYFTWKYAPVLVFVIYGILWQMSDFEVKRLEPFYQLSKKSGAAAAESLNMDYLTFLSWLVPLRALRHKQFAVIYVSLATLIASSLVPILQSASINMYPPQSQRREDEWKSIRIDPAWSRAVTACLLFVALCGAVLMYEMRRKSGLLSDPKGIAGVAAMATRSHILADFHGLDAAPLDRIHKQLRHRRYILHKSSLWQGEYIRNSKEKIHESGADPRPLMLRLRAGGPFIAYIVIVAAVIPSLMFIKKANVVTEKLPFLLTALATGIKLLWGTMNSDVRMLEPFFILSRRSAPARTLTLDYTGTNPIFLPFKALFNRHFLVALVAWGSILAEILTVCVSSLSVDGTQFIPGQGRGDDGDAPTPTDHEDRYNTEETFRSFWISVALTMGILIALVAIACLVYSRRSHKFMPRQTGTMASVLAFIHQSKMLVSFVDTEKLDSSQMTKHLEQSGKTYALGWFSGRDGDDHLGIDEEPMLAPYNYGVDWTKTRVLGNQIGTWEQY